MLVDDMKRMANVRNPAQQNDVYPHVLCCCTAGLLRSATAAVVLAGEPFHRNTRATGLGREALVPVDEVLLAWADEVVAMEQWQAERVRELGYEGPVTVLGIPDRFRYRDQELVDRIRRGYRDQHEEDEA